MDVHSLNDFTKGWFIGNFAPTLDNTNDFEIAIKHYDAGESESRHVHRVATEYTAIISGHVQMNGQDFYANDIVVIHPGESTDFVVLEKTATVVVKTPCVQNDKFLITDKES